MKTELVDETAAAVVSSPSVQPQSSPVTCFEDMDKEDVQFELRKIELERREIELKQLLKKQRKAGNNSGTSSGGPIVID